VDGDWWDIDVVVATQPNIQAFVLLKPNKILFKVCQTGHAMQGSHSTFYATNQAN